MARSDKLILVANPGSSSRKYAVYEGAELRLRAELHFEQEGASIICGLRRPDQDSQRISCHATTLSDTTRELVDLLKREDILHDADSFDAIGLRIVAPSAYFMRDHLMDDDVVAQLRALEHLAPLHIGATLQELDQLHTHVPGIPVIGVSDSAFHRTKPNYAWNYGINIDDADRFDIKRFGYHGLSAEAITNTLWDNGKLPPKVIVCHLGSGSSVTGVFHGRSIDTTMGFTPNEGIIMASRSGSISPDAARALQQKLGVDEAGLEQYLNTAAGLLGLGGSNDIRELIDREADGDHSAHLALTTMIHTIHKAIGSMLVAMNGCDLLVFTGTVGERSAILRRRIIAHLEFADFILDGEANDACTAPTALTLISQKAASRPIYAIPTDENLTIAAHALQHPHISHTDTP